MSEDYVLYKYPDSPYVARVEYCLSEVGVSYETKLVDLMSGEQYSESFKAISPTSQVPALTVGDIAVFDSMAILRFISEKHGGAFCGDSPQKRAEINAWAEFSSHEVGEPISHLAWQRYWKRELNAGVEDKGYSERQEKILTRSLPLLNERLSKKEFICGKFSIADLASFPLIVLSERAGVDLSKYSNIVTWLEKLKNRPSFQKVDYGYFVK